MKNAPPSGLVRGIRRWDLVALVINGIIGAGIFGLPSKIYALAQVYSLLAVVVCAVFAGLIMLCFAEVSSHFSETGGPYLYARETFGAPTGFVMGWLMWVTRVTSFASICNLLVTYLAHFWPDAQSGVWRALLITGIVVVLTVVNLVGVREAALVSNFFAVAKLVPLLLFVGVGLFFVQGESYSLRAPPDAKSFSTTVMLLVFAFGGFETATIAGGEVRNPQRDFPFALVVGMLIVVAVYLGIQFVCVGTLPSLAESERPLADAANQFMGSGGATLIVLGAVVSMAGILNASMLASSRLPFAMAADGHLPRALAMTHLRFHTPHVSILVSAAVALVLSLKLSFLAAASLSTLTRLAIYACTVGSLFVLRRRPSDGHGGFRAPGGVITPVAALALCGWLMLQSSWRDTRDVAIASAVGLGLFLVFWSRREHKRTWLPHDIE